MKHQIEDKVSQFKDICGFNVTSTCVYHLCDVNDEAELMDDVKADFFHSLTDMLLYITNRRIPDIKPAVDFLTTRVVKINVYDWKKLITCISYLNQTVDNVRIIGFLNLTEFFTWIDVSYAVHPNLHSQKGGVMSMGYGMIHCRSSKKNLNTKNSTEDEIIRTSECVPFNVCMVMFI